MIDRFINRMGLAKAYFKRQIQVKGMPVEYGIEITNRCNLKCIMCAREDMTRPIGDMSMEVFQRLINQISDYAELVYLHGDGEPLLHKKFFEMVKYAKNKGLRVGLSTNATTLNEKTASLLLNSGVDYLILAIDGATAETYETIRVGGNYEKVAKNIRYLLEERQRLKTPVFCLVQFISMPQNRHEAARFYEMWKPYKPDVIRIKPLVELIKGGTGNSNRHPCIFLWRSLMVDWDGTVFPCCVDTNSVLRLGNVNETPLEAIWNGKMMQKLRQTHALNNQKDIPLCRNCDMYLPGRGGQVFSYLFDDLTLKKLLPLYEKYFKIGNSMEKNKFLVDYLSVSPTMLGLIRAIDCRYLSSVDFKGSVLDVGCGDGLFAKILFDNAEGRVDTGIDYDPIELGKARKTGIYKKLFVCSATSMPFQDSCYDTVFSNSVLEHIPDLEVALSEISRVLKPGGKLVFTVPSQYLSEQFLFPVIFKKIGLKALGQYYIDFKQRMWKHYHLYPPEAWIDKLDKHGLKVIKYQYIHPEPVTRLCDLLVFSGLSSVISRKYFGRLLLFPNRLRGKILARLFKRLYYLNMEIGSTIFIIAEKTLNSDMLTNTVLSNEKKWKFY